MQVRKAARGATLALQRRIVPGLRYSQTHFEEHLTRRVRSVEAWLDLGCGRQLLPVWRASAERDLLAAVPFVVGVDYDLASLVQHRTIRNLSRADACHLPFADEAFDLVTANMVVEHLDDPPRQFAEICRVLKPGGVFLFHTPNARSYIVQAARLLPDVVKKRLVKLIEDRDEADVFPTHYRVNRPEDVASVAERVRLEVVEITMLSTVPVTCDVPPIAALELLALRLLEWPALARYRSNMIVALRKPGQRVGRVARPVALA